MTVLVRERPPLRLSTRIKTPAGSVYRWGSDDPNVANKPGSQVLSTAMPGGFDQMTCVLQRDPRHAYPDLQELSTVTVEGAGGQVAWEGRLEEFPDTAGHEAQITPQCYGWQSAFSDVASAAMIYVDQELGAFGAPPLDRQIALAAPEIWQLGQSQVAPDPGDRLPALAETITDSWASPNLPVVEAWYDAQDSGLIATVYYHVEFSPSLGGNLNFLARVFLSEDDAGGTTEVTANLYTAGGATASGYFTPADALRYAFMQFLNDATNGGAAGAEYDVYWRTAVYGNHNCPLSGTSDPKGVLASDVIAHAISTWGQKVAFTTGANGTIQPSRYVIGQLKFTPTTVAQIIGQAVQFEILDWAVWERTAGTRGPTAYVNARGERGRQWRARVGPAQLQEAGPQMSRIWNGVTVTYTAVDGTTQTVGPPGSGATRTDPSLLDPDSQNPANLAGIPRYAPLTMGTSVPSDAIKTGAQFLQTQKELDTAGQATLVGHVQDDRGVWFPAWKVRGGDTVAFVDAADSSPRRVVSTSYDNPSKANTVQLDQPPDTMTALLERMSASIGPLGLS